jgi:hypothetical protein
MEDLMKPVALNHETVETLDQIRAGAENALYGADPAQAEELFKKHLASLIVGSGMPVLQVMHYQWFLRELARLWRTRKGRDLAFHLELTIRKWVSLGLEPRTLQFLICEAHQRLKGQAKSEIRDQNAEVGSTDARSEAAQSAVSAKSADVLRDPSAPLRSPQGDSASSATSASSAVVRSGTTPSAESAQAEEPS